MAIEPLDLTPDDEDTSGTPAPPSGFRLERSAGPVTPAAPLPEGFRLERRSGPAAAMPKAPEAPLTRRRTLGEVGKDTVLGVAQGAANLVGGAASLVELTNPINRALDMAARAGVGPGPSTFAADLTEKANTGINELLSEPLKRKKQELSETEGFLPSAKKVLTDPALAGQFLAEQVPNLATLGVGTAATAARAGAAALTRGATREAAEAAAQQAGQRFVTAGGTAMEVGDATNSAIAQAMALPEDVWAQNPEYQEMLAAGTDPEAAKRSLATRAATISGAVTAPLALAGAKITAPLETTLFRRAVQPGGAAGLLSAEGAKRTAAAVGKEALEETIQEGGNQFGVNVGTATIDPSQELFEGVPEAAGTGAAVGGLLGGGMNIAGTLASRGQAAPEPTEDPGAPPPPGPLPLLESEAITVGPDGTATTPGQADRAARAAEAFQRNRENLGVTPDIEDAQARDPRFTPAPVLFPNAAPGSLAAAANALASQGVTPTVPALPAPDAEAAPSVPEAPAPQGKAADIRTYIRGQLDRTQRAPDARALAAAFGITPEAAAEIRKEVVTARKEESVAAAAQRKAAEEATDAQPPAGPATQQPELGGLETGGALRADAAGDAVSDDSAGRAGDPAPQGSTAEVEPAPAATETAPSKEGGARPLFVRLGGQTYPVDGLEDAKAKFAAFRERAGVEAEKMPPVVLVDEANKVVGRFAYNGRLLDNNMNQELTDADLAPVGQAAPAAAAPTKAETVPEVGPPRPEGWRTDQAKAAKVYSGITHYPAKTFKDYTLERLVQSIESIDRNEARLASLKPIGRNAAGEELFEDSTGTRMAKRADGTRTYEAGDVDPEKGGVRGPRMPRDPQFELAPEKGEGTGKKKAPAKKAADPKQPESRYTRPKGWEKDLPKARAVAKAMGLPHKGRSLEDLVKDVAAADQRNAVEASQKEVGKNAAGETILEDYRGVRTVVRADGARNTENVRLTPAGGFAGAATPRPAEYLTAAEAAQASPPPAAESTAPEHSAVRPEDQGVSVEELKEIAAAFREHVDSGADAEVTHIFDAPTKGEVVRLADKVKVYHKDHGWMSVAEAKALIEKWEDNAVKQGQDSLAGRNDNSDKVVLSLFDLTGSWSLPWEQAGYQVFRFDIQDGGTYEDPETGEERKVGDVNNMSVEFFGDLFGDFEGKDVYAVLAACPCTDFAVSGARHFAAKDADGRTVASVRLVEKTLAAIEYFKPAVWALENPVGRIESLTGLPPWRLSFDPNHLGDPYTKKTLIWGRFNADLPIAPVEPTEGSMMHKKFGGKSLATKNARSATPEGFAYGFFQANNAIDNPLLAVSWKFDRLDKDLIAAALDKGATAAQIDEAVREFYYTELDDEAANRALAYIGANGFPQGQHWKFWAQFKDPNASIEMMPDGWLAPADRLEAAAAEAATSPENDLSEPTDGQKAAGNYKKGHVSLNGLNITIENPAGTRRRPEWPPLAAHYGYIKRTEGADGDQVDVFLSEDAGNAELPVFVIDQRNADGTFDEHKVMLGWPDEKAARKAYLANYTKGWKGLGAITAMSLEQFKTWLRDHDTTQPLVPKGKGKKRAGAKREAEAEAFKALLAARTDTAEGVKAWLDEQLAAAGPDAARTAALEAARETVTSPKFLSSLKAKVKAARAKDARTANRDPAVYADALNAAQTGDGGIDTDARRAAFKAGWDHMLAGKTKSTLSGEESAARQAGYAAARQWAQTSAGRAWYSGKRGKKLENTGATLRRWFDKGRKDLDKAKTGSALLNALTKLTARSTLFPTEPPAEGATPGLAVYRETLRSVLPTFAELLPGSVRVYRYRGDTAAEMRAAVERELDDPEGRAKAIELAEKYAAAVGALTDAIAPAKSAAEAVELLTAAMPQATLPKEDETNSPPLYLALKAIARYGNDLHSGLLTFYKPGAWDDRTANKKHNVRIKRVLADETKGLETKTASVAPLKRPRLDTIERKGLKDHRKGKDVTPQKVKETFGLADVGFGQWVNAKADQDHLNYAFDAFMDLATVLGIEPKHIGLGGTLHLTVGALGHGKHAAHYSPAHPHPDGGRVPVINVTNTKGDGTLAHEWGHALDYHLRLGGARSGAQNPAVQALVKRLSNRPPERQKFIDEVLPRFFAGTSYMSNAGRGASGVPNARAALNYYLGQGGKTAFFAAALDLDGISKVSSNAYWSNEREMFARAFEAYVYDKLAAAGQRSDYLVSRWVAEGFATKPAYRGTPYPMGEERQKFAALFDAFLKHLDTSDEKVLDLDYVEAQKAMHEVKDEDAVTPAMEQELPKLYEDWKAEQAARSAARQAQVEAKAAEARRAAEAEAEARAEAIRRELAASLDVEPGPTDGPLTEDELDALFDEAAAELSESTQEEPDAPAAGEPALPEDDTAQAAQEAEKATAAHLTAEAAKLGVKGVGEAMAGLAKLFGAGKIQTFPGGFDEDSYNEAKPHFEAALKAFTEAGRTLKDLFKLLIQTFGDGIKPYAIQFAKENGLGRQLGGNTEEATDAADSAVAGSPRDGESRVEGAGTGPAREAAAGVDPAGLPDDARRGDARGDVQPVATAEGQGERDAAGAPAGRKGRAQRGDRAGARGNAVDRGPARRNYRAPDGSLTREGGWKATAQRNADIIILAKELERTKRLATPAEQALLAKYVGFGSSEVANNLFPPIAGRTAAAYNPEFLRDPGWQSIGRALRGALTDAELAEVMASTQYAHYTSETVTRAVWSALQRFGFAGGRVFEPGMGHGNFPMTAPEGVHGNLTYTGLERDPLTAMIARQLLQGSLVLTADYTKQKIPNDSFDAAVGNPPFSRTVITTDPDYRRHRFLLHDYFFAKTLDKVRPGGLLAFVTSAGTMNKGSEAARRYMAERADLLGAVRLPNNAFLDNAGTEVVTDVLFFRKRAPGETPAGEAWLGLDEVEVTNADGQREKVLVNEYFVAHPEMVLGKHGLTGTMYRKGAYTVEPLAGADLGQQLAEAVARLPQDVYVDNTAQAAADMDAKTYERDLDPANRKEFGIYVKDGMLMRTVQGAGRPLTADEDLKPSDTAWLADYVKLRDLYKLALKAQREDGDWQAALKKVRQAYDGLVKKHGPLTAFTESKRVTKDEDGEEKVTLIRRYKNNRLLNMDVESALVRALEREDEGGNIVPSAALTERSIAPPSPPRIETVPDALAVSLNSRGRLDLAHVAELAGVSEAQVRDQLGDLIYQDPIGGWMMADEYLSGDVVTKLEEAEAAAKADPEAYGRNVAALTRVQPKPLTPADITVHLGQAWVPVDVVNRFATEVLDVDPTVTYDSVTNAWSAGEAGRRTKGGRASEQGSEWGHRDRRPGEILDAVLNNRKIIISVPAETGDGRKTTVTDEKATTAVNEIAQKMRERFSKWVWEDADRAQRLTDLYNGLRNRTVERTFDGSHINPPGLSLKYQALHPHQKRAIWRQVQTGNTYLAHAVGAGKTLEMVIGAMEQKRLGLISKPMFSVPNHMLGQFAAEFLEAYPAANIMVADEEAFSKARRTQFIAAATANAPDAIIISHSALRLLRLQPETLAAVTDELAAELDAAMEAAEKDPDSRIKRKQLQRQREALEQRIGGKTDQEKRDDVVTFEEIGVDFLYVDEAHEFRKLDFVSSRGDIKGINPAGSARALDLFAKIRYLSQQRPGRSHVFASGTPITNTMGELYTVLKYMDLEGLTRAGLHHFDAWAAEFGEVVGDFERNAAGAWERVERFSKFNNLPELMRMVRERMDVLTSEQLGELVKRPDLTGGRPNTVVVEPTEALEDFMHGELDRRIKASRAWKPSQAEPNNPDPLLAIISDARLAVIDMRFVDPSLPNNPASKLNVMIDNIIARHKEFADLVLTDPATGQPLKGKGGTQVVFSPIGFGDSVAKSRGFDARAWVDKRLREAGIPAEQVAWIGDYDTARKRQAVFKEMRAGKKRILIGSPANMGTGVNVQNRLRYLHFLSPPWFPSDVEQPHGRILRQGNLNPEVGIDWYVTEGTYDSTGWGMVARKGKFIEQAMRGDPTLRTIEDISEVSQYAMASALASGDDRAIRLAELEGQVGRLKNLQSDFERGRHEARRERGLAETRLGRVRADIEAAEAALKVLDGDYLKADAFSFTLDNGKPVAGDGRGEQSVNLLRHLVKLVPDARALAAAKNRMMDLPLGKLFGRYDITLRAYSGFDNLVDVDLFVQVGDYRTSVLDDLVKREEIPLDQAGALGWTTRMMNAVNRVPLHLSELKTEAEQLERKVTTLTKRQAAPWPEERDLFEKAAELARLQQEMAADEEAKAAARAAKNAGESPAGEGPAPLFSQVDPGEDDGAFDAAVRALRALSYGEGIFRYPTSESTDFPTLVREVATGFKAVLKGTANTNFDEDFELNDEEGGPHLAQKWEITAADGSAAYVYMEQGGQKRMYLDAAQLTSGAGRGSAIYAALFNYAHNTGRVFIGDPAGLSEEALLRRTELMLSAALKHKSTRFMAPHPRQVSPDVRWAHPLRWTPGDDAANLRALVETSYNHALRFVPGLANGELEVRFDVGDKPRVFRGGQALPQPELRRLGDAAGSAFRSYPRAPGQEPRAAAFGGATVARGVLVDSIVRSARSGRGAGLLAGIARWFAAGGLNSAGDLANTFYSQQPAPAAGGAVARVQGWVDNLVKGWREDAPRVVVLADPEGFPAWVKADPKYRTAEGLYDERAQTIYLVASALPKRADVVRVLRHEVVGHFGIEAITGPALWDEITATVAKMRANPKHEALFAEIDRRYKGVNAAVGVREAVAVMAEKGMRNSVVDRLKAAIRKFLRALGLDVGMSEADLLAHIATAARYVRGGTRPRAAAPPAASAAPEAPALSNRAGPFYSALLEAVTRGQGAPRRGDAKAWKGWLDGAQRRGEFRQSERDWLGVDAWLEGRPSTTREELEAYVQANQVQVQDVVLGGNAGIDHAVSGELNAWMGDEGIDPDLAESEDGWNRIAARLRRHAQEADEDGYNGDAADLRRLADEAERLGKALATGKVALPVRYESFQLPGGENYRELLLTLPAPAAAANRLDDADIEFINEKLAGNDLDPMDEEQEAVARAGGVELVRMLEDFRDRLGLPLDDDFINPPAPAGTQGTFYSTHWESPNVLAHVRFNEREDDEGNRVLFIEEIQSDWHQAGRKRGYDAPRPTLAALKAQGFTFRRDSNGEWDLVGPDGLIHASGIVADTETGAYAELPNAPGGDLAVMEGGVPDAPFKATDEWAMLAFKRMVRWAAEQGFDRIAWIPGEVAADRFDLSKQVDKVSWTRANVFDGKKLVVLQPKRGDTIEFRVTPQGAVETIGGIHVEAERFAGKALDEVVGKDIAERILADDKHGFLEGAGLKFGSKGMDGFYNKILPAAVNKWAKKFGAKVGRVNLGGTQSEPVMTGIDDDGVAIYDDGTPDGVSAHSLDLTDAMRDAALQGMPLFSQADPATVLKAVDQQGARMPDGVFAKLRKSWKGLNPRNIRDNTRAGWLGALTMRHLGELGRDDGLEHVVEYSRRVQQMSADRNGMQEAVNKVADAWEAYQRKNRAEADALAGIMHDSTIDGVDPSSDYQPLMFKADKRGPKEPVTDESVKRRLAAIEADVKKATSQAQKDRLTAETNRIADVHSREMNRARAYPALAQRFGRLSEAGRQLYRDVKKAYEDQSDALEEALVARIEGLTDEGKTRAAFVTQIRERFEDARLQGPYFPLARFGKFWVSAEKDGEPIFTMYETAQAWRDGMAELRADGYVVKGAGRQVDQDRTAGTVSGGFMADLHQLLETAGVDAKTQDDVHQLFLRSLPDLSMRKHFIHRKKTAGYSNDALRAFAGNMFHGSFQIARLMHTHKLEGELQGMQAEVKGLSKEDPEKAARAAALLSEMNKRHEWVMNPKDSKVVSTLNGLGFAWYLGVTPAAALVNLTQTPIVSFPVLAARFGHAKAFNVLSATMARAVRSVRGDIAAGLPQDERDAMAIWHKDGTIDKTVAHSLAGLSEVDTRAYSTAHRRVMTFVSALFHKAEVVNREATALAAYRLARSDGMPFAEAVRYGADIVTESHFDYSNANRARWMQSNAAKVLLMFRQYSLNMTWFLWRNLYVGLKGESPEVRKQARTKLMGVLGMTGVFAGTLGLPLTSVMFGLANAAHAAFGDEDEPWDAETAYRNFLADMLGPEFSRVLSDGPVNALTGADLAGRVSLNNLWLRDPDRDLEGKAMANYLLEQAAGPMFGGMLVNTLRGMQQVGDGHTWRGVETMMPKAVKDGLRGIRYATEGVNTLRGDPIVPDLSLPETVLQLAGFSPASVRTRYDANNAAKNYEQAVLARREALTGAYAMALRNGDTELARETMAKINRFNAKHPEVAITSKTIRTSLANRFRYSARAEDGIVLNPNLALKAKEQARFSAGD